MSNCETIRVGIISDTHGHLDSRVLEVLGDCDIAVHAGDIMGKSVLEAMQSAVDSVIAVKGNNDIPAVWHADEHDALHELEHEAVIPLPGGDVVILHGHQHGNKPDHAVLRDTYTDVRMVIYGHSHKLVCDKDFSPWVVNPGAAGQTRTHGGPSCLVLEASNSDWHIEELRFPD